MKKSIFLLILIFFFAVVPLSTFSQTEVTYPSIPGVVAPQEFVREVETQEEILPLFMTYLFHLLLVVSVVVAVFVIIYGGVLYVISSGDPGKRRIAKSWILSAVHGALIVFTSYALLFTLDSQLVLFQQRGLDDSDKVERLDLKWEIKNIYFQIPFGLLTEDAILNENAQNKLYDVLDATYDAEDTADAIVEGSKQLLAIIESCPDGDPCCDEYPVNSPPIDVDERDLVDRDKQDPAIGDFITWPGSAGEDSNDDFITWPGSAGETLKGDSIIDPLAWNIFDGPDEIPSPPPMPEGDIMDWRDNPNIQPFRLGQVISTEEKESINQDAYSPVDDSGNPKYTEKFGFITNRGKHPDRWHLGVDIAAEKGTPMTATHGGEILLAEYSGGMGNTVQVLYTSPAGRSYILIYAHLDSISVNVGDNISGGQNIGSVGMTGNNVGYNHLHYEVIPIPDGADSSFIDEYRKYVPLSRWNHAIDPIENGFLPADKNPFWTTSPFPSFASLFQKPFSFLASLFGSFIGETGTKSGALQNTFLFNIWFLALALFAFVLLSPKTFFSRKLFLIGKNIEEKRNFFTKKDKNISTTFISLLLIFSLLIASFPIDYGIQMQRERNEMAGNTTLLSERNVYAEESETGQGEEGRKGYWEIVQENSNDAQKVVISSLWGLTGGAAAAYFTGAAAAVGAGAIITAPAAAIIVGTILATGAAVTLSMSAYDYYNQSEVEEISDISEKEDFDVSSFEKCPDGCWSVISKSSCDFDGGVIKGSVVYERDGHEITLFCCCPQDVSPEPCPDDVFSHLYSEGMCPDNAPEECKSAHHANPVPGYETRVFCCCSEIEELTSCEDVLSGSEMYVENPGEGYECSGPVDLYGENGEIEHADVYCCLEEIDECPEETDVEESTPCEDLDPPMITEYSFEDPETGETIYCCIEDEMECVPGDRKCEGDTVVVCVDGFWQEEENCKDRGEEWVCRDGECILEEDCPACPDIAPAVQAKIAEIEKYMAQLAKDLDVLLQTKEPIKEDLYQLYKAIMLKSLGHRQVFGYNSLLLERRYYEREEVVIETDTEKTQIGPYTWDWSQWVGNILYQIHVGGKVIEENDPATFYLRRPESNKLIEDALRIANEAKASDIQKIGKKVSSEKESSSTTLARIQSFASVFLAKTTPEEVLALSSMEKMERCLKDHGISDWSTLEGAEFTEYLEICEIDISETDLPDWTKVEVKTPADYLLCGMEIPVGEVFDLTWEHLIELLDTVDDYIEEGKKLIEQQAKMNELARPCDCPCEGDEECPTNCGACDLKCDLNAIRAAHQEVLETREKMREIASHIELLTYGHFNTSTENVCDPLNEDIRDEEEKTLCQGGGSKLITKHELITRKLNYSRYEFDECSTRPEHLEDVLEGKRAGKMPFFGPLVEERDIPRYTKTKVGGSAVNTSEFNWFCCSDARFE